MVDVIVKKSKINGKGVFAARDFKKGEIVLKSDLSHELTMKEIEKLDEIEKRYIWPTKGKYILMLSPGRYVNHSCNPNTYIKNSCDIALRDIKKGDEITGDYALSEEPGFEMICKCKSKNCRKIIRVCKN
jgi:uncharacterized protein